MLSEAQAQAVLRQLETQMGGWCHLLVSTEKSSIAVHKLPPLIFIPLLELQFLREIKFSQDIYLHHRHYTHCFLPVLLCFFFFHLDFHLLFYLCRKSGRQSGQGKEQVRERNLEDPHRKAFQAPHFTDE